MKKCSECLHTKELGQFTKDKSGKSGVTSKCKKCRAVIEKVRRSGSKRDEINRKQRLRRKNNPEKFRQFDLKARDKRNKVKERADSSSRNRERRKTDPIFRLKCQLRERLNKSIKNNYKSGSAVRDLGCTINQLKHYLQIQFEKGMSWDNHGEWHIDHIRPLSSFDLTDREQLLQACYYGNLQPLWAKDNLSKGNKYETKVI